MAQQSLEPSSEILSFLSVIGVMLGAVLGSLGMVVFGLKVMTIRDVCVVVSLAVAAFLVGLGGLMMMFGGFLVVLGCLGMVLGEFRTGHLFPPSSD
jgi:hypothetical protein